MLPQKAKTVHYESVPPDATASFTLREFDWPRFPFNWHYHPEVELTLIVRGRGIRFVAESAEDFADGDLCLLGSNTPHCWASHKDAEPGVRSLVVQFRPETWGEQFWELPEVRLVGRLLAGSRWGLQVLGTVRREVAQLFSVLQRQPQGSLQRLDTLLEMLHLIADNQENKPLAAATTQAPADDLGTTKLGKILRYIHAHLGPDLTQREVADAVHLSPAAFSQFFRRSLGQSYVHYANELKIRNACRALLDTDQPITEIAYAAGFNNLSHFNSQFRRLRQMSPRAFRQRAQAVEPGTISAPPPGESLAAAEPAITQGRDLTVHGKGSHFDGTRVGNEEPRPWLKRYALCPALEDFGIVHLGVVQTRAPYTIVRTNQSSHYFLACIGGRGQVLVDGRWRTIRPGLACLLPAHVNNAFRAIPDEAWEFAYVCYQEQTGPPGKFSASSPVVTEFDTLPLRLAIQGLTAECRSGSRPAQIRHWLELVQGYVLGFAQPCPQASPLPELWQRVATRLQEEWSPERLAREAGCSTEKLRRLCLRELGRSPLQHLTHLRMHRATQLLGTTGLRLHEVAKSVGYPSPLTFSNAFKSNVGCRPSEYRQRAATQEPAD